MALNDNTFVMSVNNQKNLIENKGSLPVADSNEINGGRMIVSTTVERNQIVPTKRKVGMEVYVLETQTPYILQNNDITKQATTDNDWIVLKNESSKSSDKLTTPRLINGVPFDGTQDIEFTSEPYTAREIVDLFDDGKVTIKRSYDLLLPRFATRIYNRITEEKSTLGEDNVKSLVVNTGDTLVVDVYDMVKSIKMPLYQTSYETNKVNNKMSDFKLALISDQGTTVSLGSEFPAAITSTLNITVAFKINGGNLEDSIGFFIAIPYKTDEANVTKFKYKYAKLTKNSPGSLVYEGKIIGIAGSYYNFLENTDGELDNFAVPITIISKDSEVTPALKAL